MTLTLEEFNQFAFEFLATRDDTLKEEWYCTSRDVCDEVLTKLRDPLFAADISREARRAQYEALKKEFEP